MRCGRDRRVLRERRGGPAGPACRLSFPAPVATAEQRPAMDDVFEVSAPAQPDGDDPFAAAPPADFGSEPMPQFEAPSDMGSFEPPADVPAFETPAEPTDAPVFEAAP
eukprot:5678987-Prymnesium_polylepis.1